MGFSPYQEAAEKLFSPRFFTTAYQMDINAGLTH
jgi:hypothetical protein